MPLYQKKPVIVEAITFEVLVEYGMKTRCYFDVEKQIPWSFEYKGHLITHGNDDCYLIPTLEGTMKFNRGDMLIIGVQNEIYPCRMDIFRQTYKRVPCERLYEDCEEVKKREGNVTYCQNCG